MKTQMLKMVALVCCFFVTNLRAESCWQNEKAKSVMPQKICFDEIHLQAKITKGKQNLFKNIYMLNADIDEIWPISTIEALENGNFKVSLKADYLNYSENCGLNLFSKIDFSGIFSAEGKYINHPVSKLKIQYTYSANNCRAAAFPGVENYFPIIK